MAASTGHLGVETRTQNLEEDSGYTPKDENLGIEAGFERQGEAVAITP